MLAVRRGSTVETLERHRLSDTMETTGHVAVKLREPAAIAVVDVIGIGAGVVDRLREQRMAVVAFNAAEKSDRRDRTGELAFLNQRSQAWWHLRELLDPAYGPTLALPDDEELIGDLCAPKWRINSGGKVQIESKDEIRKRLGRSTDAGDAVVMACTLSLSTATDPATQRVVPWTGIDPRVPFGAVPWASSFNARPDPYHGSEFER